MIEIKSRYDSSETVYRSEKAETVREAVIEGVMANANLADADLAGADLAGADLADADLAGADLTDANLADANLTRADLADADLAGDDLTNANLADANLTRVDLAGANLTRANLAGANLTRADLTDANLTRAYLAGANLTDANLTRADLTNANLADADGRTREERRQAFRERNPDVPIVAGLDRRILDAIEAGGSLNMGAWHSCDTTHCRAGWAITLAGAAGRELEARRGPFHAGRLIYLASTGRAPHFFATNEDALADIRKCAAEETP
jgi:hypothetical protein